MKLFDKFEVIKYKNINMKHIILILALILMTALSIQAQDTTKTINFRNIPNNAFKAGEKLDFDINYGFINAGTATMYVEPNTSNLNGRDCYLVKLNITSSPSFEFIYKFNELYKSYLDKQGLFPWMTEQDKTEGKDYKYMKTEFVQDNQTAIITERNANSEEKKKEVKIDLYTLDEIGAFYYARTLDMSGRQPGEVTILSYLAKDEVKELKIKYLGKENVETAAGNFRCVILQPMLKESSLASKVDDVTVWITDDENKIPVKIQMKIIIGAVKIELKSYQGTGNIKSKI